MKNHGTKISNGIGVGETGFSTASLASHREWCIY